MRRAELAARVEAGHGTRTHEGVGIITTPVGRPAESLLAGRSGGDVGRRRACQRLFFESEVGVDVNLGGPDVLVTEP